MRRLALPHLPIEGVGSYDRRGMRDPHPLQARRAFFFSSGRDAAQGTSRTRRRRTGGRPASHTAPGSEKGSERPAKSLSGEHCCRWLNTSVNGRLKSHWGGCGWTHKDKYTWVGCQRMGEVGERGWRAWMSVASRQGQGATAPRGRLQNPPSGTHTCLEVLDVGAGQQQRDGVEEVVPHLAPRGGLVGLDVRAPPLTRSISRRAKGAP